MRKNIDLYRGGYPTFIGQQALNQIGGNRAIPFALQTPESATASGLANMVRALTAKAEKDKEDKIRTDMLAAMVGPGYEYDPSKASESFTPSPLMESHRVALANAQDQAQTKGVSALGLGSDSTNLTPSLQSMPYTDFEPEDIETLIAQSPSLGISSEALVPPQFESTEFTPQPNLGDDAAMRAALIGDVATPEEELAAYAGSPEDRAAQERVYTATVNTPDAVAARMAEAVRLNPDIAKDPAYAQFVQSNLARQQALRDAAIERERAAALTAADREFQKELKELEFGFKKGDNQFDKEDKLRKEFEKGTKDFIKVRDAFGRIQASASDPSAAGDLALIFNFMKVLDPGSTVREGEFATAASAAGVDQRLRAQYNKVIEGTRLGNTQREDFVNRAQKLYGSQLNQYQSHEDYYRGLAETYNLNPENVVYGMGESITLKNFGTGDSAGAAAGNGIDLAIVPDGVDPAIWGNMTEEDQLEYHRLAGERDAIF
jgi:hypothetical protein